MKKIIFTCFILAFLVISAILKITYEKRKPDKNFLEDLKKNYFTVNNHEVQIKSATYLWAKKNKTRSTIGDFTNYNETYGYIMHCKYRNGNEADAPTYLRLNPFFDMVNISNVSNTEIAIAYIFRAMSSYFFMGALVFILIYRYGRQQKLKEIREKETKEQ